MKEFDGQSAERGSDAFERWLRDNESGFYVNQLGPARGRLHKAHCSHIYPPTPGLNLVANTKYASANREQLVAEVGGRGITLLTCSTCGA